MHSAPARGAACIHAKGILLCYAQVGGRLVYSTCTFNPIEDEAVVAEVCLLSCWLGDCIRLPSPLPTCQKMTSSCMPLDSVRLVEQVQAAGYPCALQVLRCAGPSMELLDVSDQLPALTRMPGLQSWRVKVINHSTATVRASR